MKRWKLLAWALFAVAVLLAALSLMYTFRSLGGPTNTFGFRGAIALLTATTALVGVVLASRLPANPIGWIFLAIGVASGIQAVAGEYATYAIVAGDRDAADVGSWVDSWAWVPITGAIGIHIFLLFPNGRPPSPGWRWVAWTGAAGILLFGSSFALATNTELGLRNPFIAVDRGTTDLLTAVGASLYLGSLLAAVVSLIVRFRRATGDERQQLRWFATAASLVGIFLVFTFVNEFFFPNAGLFSTFASSSLMLAFMAVPATTGLAVLKYRLYDLDVVISRAVLYGVLAALITALYIGVVVGIGALVGSRGNLLLSILATALIAVGFHPLRDRVRRFANRLVYGDRATPYEVLSQFSDGLGAVYSTEEILPRLARLLGEGTGGETGVWVHVGDRLRLAASWPEPPAATTDTVPVGQELPLFAEWDRAYPVRHHGKLLGALTIRKPPQEPLTGAEERLVDDVAGQAGLVLGNVRLIEELRASRQRLVSAQDEERRRLERNIHDGAQQQLVALAVKLRLVEGLAEKDAAKARQMASEAKAETQEALENLRDLARGIYPPLLADKGLAAALEAQARKAPMPVDVEPDGVGRYPQEAEAAAYFCVLEALQNVAKYANASHVMVRLRAEDGTLVFAVEDDGRGFDLERTPPGSGLQNMADRLESLGGRVDIRSSPGTGTTVTGRIPIGSQVQP